MLFRARSNSLKLGWRQRFLGGNTECKQCSQREDETLKHFLVDCSGLEGLKRDYHVENKTLAEILLLVDGCDVNMTKKYIGAAWRKRLNHLRPNDDKLAVLLCLLTRATDNNNGITGLGWVICVLH